MAKVMEIVLLTLIPIRAAAPLSSDTARIALPARVLLINHVRITIAITVTTKVTIVIPEICMPPILNEDTLMTEPKGIGVALKISSATFCKK